MERRAAGVHDAGGRWAGGDVAGGRGCPEACSAMSGERTPQRWVNLPLLVLIRGLLFDFFFIYCYSLKIIHIIDIIIL